MIFLLEIIRRPNGMIGATMLSIVFLAALVGWVYTPYDPVEPDFLSRFASPSAAHWLGSDMFGRDLLSRIMAGAGVSFIISGLTVFLAVTFGVLLGGLSGFYRGWFDRCLMTIFDAVMSFPGLLLALAIMTITGPSKYGVVLALSIAYLPSVTRLVRGCVLSVKEKEFVEASIALGNSELYTLFRHILPNCIAPLIVYSTTMFGAVLLAESSLSFLGLGVPPPAPTWGNMLAEAKGYLTRFPWLGILPGVCISLTLVGINLLGDALRDALDPRMKKLK